MHHQVLLEINGESAALGRFVEQALDHERFSFEWIDPVPATLRMAADSRAEDGHAAVAGDWQSVASRDLLREPARALGLAFPLTQRAAVLACYRALGPDGEEQLAWGRRIEHNLSAHGHPYAAPWRKAHWGTEGDARDLLARIDGAGVCLSFRVLGQAPTKVLARLSARHADLDLRTLTVQPSGRRAMQRVLRKGREAAKEEVDAADTLRTIVAFRRSWGPGWLAAVCGVDDVGDAVCFDESGQARLAGTGMALSFALSRLEQGESASQLAARFAELGAHHVVAIERLFRAGYNQPFETWRESR
jgi:hypothetical protein